MLQPAQVTDPNGHSRHVRYSPLGLPQSVFLRGRDGEGGSEDQPEVQYRYDLRADPAADKPVSVCTVRRTHHASEGISDDVIQTLEYSDGVRPGCCRPDPRPTRRLRRPAARRRRASGGTR